MSILRRITLAFLILLIPFWAIAQSSSQPDNSETVDQIFEMLPVDGMLKEIPEELGTQFEQNPFRMPESQNKEMLSAYSDAFSLQMMLPDARSYFVNNLDPDMGQKIVGSLSSDSIQSPLDAWKDFYTIQGVRKRIVSRYEIEQSLPGNERKRLIDSLAVTTGLAESQLESQTIIFRSLVSAFNKISANQSLSDSQIEQFVQNFKSRIKNQIDQEVRDRLLIMFHGIKNDTLQSYLHFLQSDSGNTLYSLIMNAKQSAYEKAAKRFLSSI